MKQNLWFYEWNRSSLFLNRPRVMSKSFMLLCSSLWLATMNFACGGYDSDVPDSSSGLANIEIKKPSNLDFDVLKFGLNSSNSGSSATAIATSYPKDHNGKIERTVSPGSYTVVLEYYKGEKKIYAADLCDASVRNDKVTLKAGPNPLKIKICDSSQQPADADLSIDPEMYRGDSTPEASPQADTSDPLPPEAPNPSGSSGPSGPSVANSDPLPAESAGPQNTGTLKCYIKFFLKICYYE